MRTPATVEPETSDSNPQAFAFVQGLAKALSSGQVSLPSFPDVAVRLQEVLNDRSVTTDDVVRILGSDPSLAARLLRVANSAAFNTSDRRAEDLKTAVLRLGFDLVRSATIAFAFSQLKHSKDFQGLEAELEAMWDRSTLVAAISQLIARRTPGVNPDEATLAGLLHGVGRLYILSRLRQYPLLEQDAASSQHIVANWHAEIAKVILENWGMPEGVVAAVHHQTELERGRRSRADLTDVIIVGSLTAGCHDRPENLGIALLDLESAERLALDEAALRGILKEGDAEIAALRLALGL